MILMLFVYACSLDAQTQKASIGLFGGLCMPNGGWADDNPEDINSGYAKTGFCVGGEFVIPLDRQGFSVALSTAILMNGTEEVEVEIFGDDATIDISSWLNIPIMGGSYAF